MGKPLPNERGGPHINMVTTVVRGPETRAQKRKRVRDAKLGEAIPGLLDDIVITHVLRSEH